MNSKDSIISVREIFQGRRINLPKEAGVYAFWWIGEESRLMSANRRIKLKGPGGDRVEVEYRDWWTDDMPYPCLYVGKTTNIKNRFSLHIKRGSPGRLHAPLEANMKAKPRTTSCQLRFGIEHVFRDEQEPLGLIFGSVGFSYSTEFPDNAIAERFFEEDRLIGAWRPWFNIDSER